MSNRDVLIGIDLGGSAIKAGLVTREGKVSKFRRYELAGGRGEKEVVRFLKKVMEDLSTMAVRDNRRILASGIGSAGIIDMEKGVIVTSPNFSGWKNVPLRDLLKDSIDFPLYLDNDANSAAYGEKWVGAGKLVRSMICLTMGTGIGGGIILDGDVWHGDHGMGGEIGHITVNPEGPKCLCGNTGCLEVYASATGMVRNARELIKKGEQSLLTPLSGGDISRISGKMIYKAAVDGDRVSLTVLNEAGKYLGITMANLMNLLNPSMIVLTGEVTGSWEFFMPVAKKEVKKRAFPAIVKRTKMVRGKLPDRAGVIGAAGLALKSLET